MELCGPEHYEDEIMKRISMALLAVGSLIAVAQAGEAGGKLSDPVQILKKADAATRAVHAVSFSTKIVPTGAAKGVRPTIHGTAFVSGWTGTGPELFRHEIQLKSPGDSAPESFTAGSDGENYYLIDHQTKTAYVDIDPQVIGKTARVLRTFSMIEFVHPTPFSDEINGTSQKLEGVEDVGGEPCYKIDVSYATGGMRAVWYFSTKDFLPRGVERMFPTPDGKLAGQMMTVSNLKVIKSASADLSAFKLPAGYKQTDDFAP